MTNAPRKSELERVMPDPQPTREAVALMHRLRTKGPASRRVLDFMLSDKDAALEIDRFAAQHSTAAPAFIDIVFDGPPSHESGRFVEAEDPQGRSINAGEWIKRDDGYWALRIPRSTAAPVSGDARERAQTLWLQTICGGKDDKTDDEIITLIAAALTDAASERAREDNLMADSDIKMSTAAIRVFYGCDFHGIIDPNSIDAVIIRRIAAALTTAKAEAIEECARIADEAAGLSAKLRLTHPAEDIAANIRAINARVQRSAPPGEGG